MKAEKIKSYKEVAKRLNEKGIKPFSAREWNMPLVRGILYGSTKNEKTIELVRKEYEKVLLDRIQNGTR